MKKWQVLKGSISIGVYDTIEEAEDAYHRCDGDVIRKVKNQDESNDNR